MILSIRSQQMCASVCIGLAVASRRISSIKLKWHVKQSVEKGCRSDAIKPYDPSHCLSCASNSSALEKCHRHHRYEVLINRNWSVCPFGASLLEWIAIKWLCWTRKGIITEIKMCEQVHFHDNISYKRLCGRSGRRPIQNLPLRMLLSQS